MGIRFPEFDVWQEQGKVDAQEEWAEIQKIQKMAYEAGGDMALLARKRKAQIAELQAKEKCWRLKSLIWKQTEKTGGRDCQEGKTARKKAHATANKTRQNRA